jgi:hypothetical protein
MLGQNVMWPIIASIIIIFVTAMVMSTLTRSYNANTYSYDSNGKITTNKTAEIKGITSRKSKSSFGSMRVPAGHALTIPFMVAMLLWLL